MKDIDKFVKAIRPYLDAWQFIDIRTVAFLAYEKWINIGTRIVLSQSTVSNPVDQAMLPTMPRFCALHEVRAIAELDDILEQLQSCRLTVCKKDVHFGTIDGNEVKLAPLNFGFQQARRGTRYFQIDYPSISLVHWGQGLHNLFHNHAQAPGQDELDWQLRSLTTPYDGLEDLLVNFLGAPRQMYEGTPSTLTEIVAPLGVRLGNQSTLSNQTLTVHVQALGTQDPEDISLGVIALSGISPVRRVACELSKDDVLGSSRDVHKEVLIGAASSATIILSMKGNAFDIQTINDPAVLLNNPRIMTYSHFDQGLAVFNEYLSGKGRDQSGDFEIGIGLLFHFCGFNVGPYGRVKALKSKSIQEEIDHLIFAPSENHVIAIECTSRDLDTDGKLSKFSRRVKELRDLLPSFSVTPMVCTPLRKALIAKTDIQKTEKEQLGVVAAEEIQAILELAGQNKEPEEILDFLNSLIKKPDELPFWDT